jgi:hypothetical protein
MRFVYWVNFNNHVLNTITNIKTYVLHHIKMSVCV